MEIESECAWAYRQMKEERAESKNDGKGSSLSR